MKVIKKLLLFPIVVKIRTYFAVISGCCQHSFNETVAQASPSHYEPVMLNPNQSGKNESLQ